MNKPLKVRPLSIKAAFTMSVLRSKLLRFRSEKIFNLFYNELAYCIKCTSENATTDISDFLKIKNEDGRIALE